MRFLNILQILAISFFLVLASTTKTYAQKLDSLMTIVNKLDDKAKFLKINELTNQLLKQDDVATATLLAKKGSELAAQQSKPDVTANSFTLQGKVFEAKYDYTNAMKAYVSALKLRNDAKDEKGIAQAKNNIGRIFYFEEEYTLAEENLIEAQKGFSAQKDQKGLSKVTKYLGDVFLAKKVYGKAMEHYRSAMELHLALEDVNGAAKIATDLGNIATDLGDYDGANNYYQASLDLHASTEDTDKIADDLDHITNTLIIQKEYEEALENNHGSFGIRQAANDELGLARAYKTYGEIYAKLGKRKESAINLSKGEALTAKLGNHPEVPFLYQSISESYNLNGDYQKAFENQKAYANSRASVFNEEKSKALLELTTKYESEFAAEEQARQIELLEVQQASSRKMQYFLFGIIGLIGLSLLGGFFAYRAKQKDNLLLKAQKDEIDAQNIKLEENNATQELLNKQLVDEMAEREAMEKNSFARDRFLATMSHEMRTPMNIIVGLTHLLLEDNPREDQVEHLRTLQYSTNNLVVFINDVLDFNKIEAGKLNLESREFKPAAAFDEISTRFREIAEKKGVNLRLNYDQKIPKELIGDSARLNQIVTNLVNTSVNYTEEGSVDVDVKLLELKKETAFIQFEISDTGKGIEPEKIQEMFRSYSKSENDAFEGYASSDLGLAITKRLIDLQNGNIEVDSELGGGTVFTVVLPYKLKVAPKPTKSEGKATSKVTNDGANKYDHLQGKRILVVEDNKINQLVVAKLLAKLEMEVTTADDGMLALDKINEQDFDLILMDIQMPNMDGYRATAEIRKNHNPTKRDTPIIALTASAFLTEKEKAKLFGMNDHVGKPFAPEDLLEKISHCLKVHKTS